MSKLPVVEHVSDIRMGKNPALEAWLYHFLTENNLEYLLNPSFVASPEQLRFMVALRDDQIYLPCGDSTFQELYDRREGRRYIGEYRKAWLFIVKLVKSYNMNRSDERRVLGFCRYRFQMYLESGMVLPSRLIKRLVGIVLTQCGDNDPFRDKKRVANQRAAERLRDSAVRRALLHCAPDFGTTCADIPSLRWEMDLAEIARLMLISTQEGMWEGNMSVFDMEDDIKHARKRCDCLRRVFGPESEERRKILFIPDVAGGFMFDLALIRALLRQGHQVVLVMKDAFYFNTPTVLDLEYDMLLKEMLGDAHVVPRDGVSKNDLLQLLRERRFLLISDGTSEQLNLYRTGVTFARAWKECDVVFAKGLRNKRVLIDSSHDFTRDIISWWREEDGSFHIQAKPKAPWIRKFAEKDLLTKARELISDMKKAKAAGKTIMFYSAVIGSIPGQTKTAIALVNAFVGRLREKMEGIFIINPAEHFEEGMDGDDLMYMWERVQRSGLLDVWRFQTVEDIEAGFVLLERKVPSVWTGKDSTFSTGCTKEMRIALDMQQKQPELQIIGPAPERFFRRRDYGVGKYFDATLRA